MKVYKTWIIESDCDFVRLLERATKESVSGLLAEKNFSVSWSKDLNEDKLEIIENGKSVLKLIFENDELKEVIGIS